MRNLFLGLDADEWEAADGLPRSPMTDAELTVDDVKAGLVAMLRRLDDPGRCKARHGWFGPRCELLEGHDGKHERTVSERRYEGLFLNSTSRTRERWL